MPRAATGVNCFAPSLELQDNAAAVPHGVSEDRLAQGQALAATDKSKKNIVGTRRPELLTSTVSILRSST